MKSSCISHPASEPLIIIHKWQIEACQGNACAAALLSFFEYWHNIKLAQSAKAKQMNAMQLKPGDSELVQDESLLQFHNEDQLETGVLIYKRDTIKSGIALLEQQGFITIHPNPNPRYAYDKTRHFLFHPNKVQEWIDHNRNFRDGKLENPSLCRKNPSLCRKNPSAIPETTSETTTERGIHVPPNGKPMCKTDIILHDKELNRVNQKIDLLRHQYSDHQTWTPTDSAEFSKLKRRKTELMSILGLQA